MIALLKPHLRPVALQKVSYSLKIFNMHNIDVRALSSSLSEEKSKEVFAVGDSRKEKVQASCRWPKLGVFAKRRAEKLELQPPEYCRAIPQLEPSRRSGCQRSATLIFELYCY